MNKSAVGGVSGAVVVVAASGVDNGSSLAVFRDGVFSFSFAFGLGPKGDLCLTQFE